MFNRSLRKEINDYIDEKHRMISDLRDIDNRIFAFVEYTAEKLWTDKKELLKEIDVDSNLIRISNELNAFLSKYSWSSSSRPRSDLRNYELINIYTTSVGPVILKPKR